MQLDILERIAFKMTVVILMYSTTIIPIFVIEQLCPSLVQIMFYDSSTLPLLLAYVLLTCTIGYIISAKLGFLQK